MLNQIVKIHRELLQNSYLRELNLRENNINYRGAFALAFNQTIQKLRFSYETINFSVLCFFLGNQALENVSLRVRTELKRRRLFEFVTHRNSLFQNRYQREVEKELLNHCPLVLTHLIQGYTSGEYPYRLALFQEHRSDMPNQEEISLLLSQVEPGL